VKIRDADFRTRQASRTLPAPLRTDAPLHRVARELFAALRARRRMPARLLGVAFSALEVPGGPAQLDLLPVAPAAEAERADRLASAVDAINRKLGERAITPARLVRSDGRRSP
jgi:DNA polymerase IV